MNDLFAFLKARQKWLLLPFIIILLLVAGLVMIAGSTAISPFIYTIF